MTYDPFQSYTNYAGPSAYSGFGNPFQTPFTSMQSSAINPAAAWNPLTAYQGQFNPQAAYWQNPLLVAGLHHGVAQNPYLHPHLAQQMAAQQMAAQQLAAQQLAQHLIAQQQIAAQQIAAQQIAAQQGGQYPGLYPQVGQIGFAGQATPFGQTGSPFGQIGMPLAPQSWVGQAGQLGGGQTNPVLLAQLTARALQAQGINPGVGFQG